MPRLIALVRTQKQHSVPVVFSCYAGACPSSSTLNARLLGSARWQKKKLNGRSDRNKRQDLSDPWDVQGQLPGWSGPPRSGQQPNGQTGRISKGSGHGTLPNGSQQLHESPDGSYEEEDDQVGHGPVMQGGQHGQEQNGGGVRQSVSQSKEKSYVISTVSPKPNSTIPTSSSVSTSELTTTTIKKTGMASNATVLPTEKNSTLKPSSSPLPKIPTSSPTTSTTTTLNTTTTTPTTTEPTTAMTSTIPLTTTTVTIEAPTTLPPETAKPSTTVGPTTVPPPLSTTDKPTVRSTTVETTGKPLESDVSEEVTRAATTETTIGSGNENQSGTIIGHEKPVKKSVHGAVIVIPALVLLVLKMQMSPPLIKKKRPPQPKPVQAGKLDQEHHKFVGPLRMDVQLRGPVRHGTEQAPRSGSLKDVVFDEKDNKVYDIGSDIKVMSKQASRSGVVDDTDNTLIAGTVNQKL